MRSDSGEFVLEPGRGVQTLSDGALNKGAESLPIDPATPLFLVRSFNLLFITRVASTTAFQMISVVVGWHVYELTDSLRRHLYNGMRAPG